MDAGGPIERRLLRNGLAGVSALLLMAALPASAHRVEKHYTVEGRPVITLHNAQGRIEIKSWNKPEVAVIGTHASDKVEVDTEQVGNRIEVVTHVRSEKVAPTDLQADYSLMVPEESELQIRTDSGSILVDRVHGDLTFHSVAGDVQLQDVSGYLAVKTAGGSVVCLRCVGRFEANSISGNVQLLQTQLDTVRVETSSGSILFDGDFLRRGIYILKNYSGVIEVRFSSKDSFDLSASSLYGTVENEANLKPDIHGKRHAPTRFGNALIGTMNEGHAKVELSSFSGTIRIRKRD